MRRGSGILLHISSLPSAYGIGDFGSEAYKFVDFLKENKQLYWQILPLTPTELRYGNSPYSSPAAFAGNTLFISPDFLVKDGLLKQKNLKPPPAFTENKVNYSKVVRYKSRILKSAFENFKRQKNDCLQFKNFCSEQADWLGDYALFMALREVYKNKPWNEWPKDIRARQPQALKYYFEELSLKVEERKFYQYILYQQWSTLKNYANENFVKIIGDIPIYVNFRSADVWAHPRLFKLNENLKPKFVAGVPPDYYSKTGQRWGNPVYDWNQLKKTKYDWWMKRITHNLKLFDFIRIDHFRGFAAYWQIPSRQKTAVHGRWIKVPGQDFFKTFKKAFPKLPVIAEDVGYITPDVIKLRDQFKLPGTKILQFAFDGKKHNPDLPHNYSKNCVVYTGTHDNNTILGWYKKELTQKQKDQIAQYVKKEPLPENIHWMMVELALNSTAKIAITPLQDILGLGEEARMNKPATAKNNWDWRVQKKYCNEDISNKLLTSTKMSKRI